MSINRATATHKRVLASGVSVLSVDPPAIDIDVDSIEPHQARIRASLPGVELTGAVRLDQSTAIVLIPSQLRSRLPDDLVVDAVIEASVLERLDPEIEHTRTARLRLPEESLRFADAITLEPESVQMTFAIRSRLRQITLDSVRVQLAGPPED